MCSQLLDWLIHREAWGIGGDLKKDASRFAKVNRVEVLAIHHRSDIEVEASQSLAPRLLLLISGRSPSHVMDRSSRNQSAPKFRSTSYINIRPRPPSLPDRKSVLGRKGEKKPSEEERSSYLRERTIDQEDDHECIRPIISSMEPTSQGDLSGITPLSTTKPRLLCSRNHSVRQCGDATGSPSVLGIFEQRD